MSARSFTGRAGRIVIAGALVASGLMGVQATAGAVTEALQDCVGTVGAGTVSEITVSAGKVCTLEGTTVTGAVNVGADARLEATGVTIGGAVQAADARGVSLVDSSVAGAVNLTAGAGSWEVGYLYLVDSTVGGGVQTNGGLDVEISGSEITGNLSTTGANYADVFKTKVSGALSITNSPYGTYLCGVRVGGNATLTGHGYEVAAFGDTPNADCDEPSFVEGDLRIADNTADTQVGSVKVTGNLDFAGNTPAAVVGARVSYCGTTSGETTGKAPAQAWCEAGAEAALDWTNYERVTLTKEVGEPVDLAVLPDGRVLHTARNGTLRMTDPGTGSTTVVNNIPVYNNSEDGLQTVGLSPNFAEDNWVYIYYAPPGSVTGNAPNTLPAGADPETYWAQWMGINRLSRFQWTGSSLDLDSEQIIIEVPVNRGQCCHVGGDFDWDEDGNLYLGTGDNTPATAPGSNGFAPNNDVPNGNPGNDARRGAGNTNDLRGKILRITPNENTPGYTIPEGNLFPVGTDKTKPEIFVMGVRNPFRLDVDSKAGTLTWGDYGPDSGTANPQRGPMGYVEWNAIALDNPVNAGWPYCHGGNSAYNEWNFQTSTMGDWFDCDAPKNNSRHNTGLVDLPPARAATLWYGDNPGQQPWDELVIWGGGGQAPMGGPVYHYDPNNPSSAKFPPYWDGKHFFGEWSQDYMAAFTLDSPNGEVSKIEEFLPNAALIANYQPIHDNPMDMEFGPDGALYVLDYGDGYFTQNRDAGLYRIAYAGENKSPTAAFTASPISGSSAPLTVNFDASTSFDPDGSAITYEWDFTADGVWDATGVTASYTYTELGSYTARLRVTDPQGKTGLITRKISVGNQAPEITVVSPGNGSFFTWGKAVPFQVTTADAEDGATTVCTRVAWTFGLGHAEHAHPESIGTGCRGAWATPVGAPEHGKTEKIYGAVVINYTDNGHNGLPGATADVSLTLNPKNQQAEHANRRVGVEDVEDSTRGGSGYVAGLGAGDYLEYTPVNFAGITGIQAIGRGNGTLSLRWNSTTGPVIASFQFGGSGWQTIERGIVAPFGSGSLFVTATGNVDLDEFTVIGAGVDDLTAPTVSHTLNPANPQGVGGVYNTAVGFRIVATDNGTLSQVQYSTNNGTSWTTQNPTNGVYPQVNYTTNGTRTILYRATDNSGNRSTGSVTFTVNLQAASRTATTTTISVPAPAVNITSSPKATVTVTGGTPGGTVDILRGDAVIGTGELNANGTAVISLTGLNAGVQQLRAVYRGDNDHMVSESASVNITGYFSDVAPAHPFYLPIQWAAREGITTGNANGSFTPSASITRQALAAMLFRFANPGAPKPVCTARPFSDVDVTNAFCGEITWMAQQGISTGYGDGTFRPNETVKRDAISAFLHRLATGGAATPTCTTAAFPDVPASHQFCGAISWMVANGITNGYSDGSFQPGAAVSRDAVAAFLYRLDQLN